MEGQRIVPLDALKPGRFNPRRNFCRSAARGARGLDPRARAGAAARGAARPTERRAYEIVAGERRWRAAQLANLHEVPVVVRALSDKEAIEIAIIENVQREDLNAIEEGEGYRLLMDGHGYTQEDLAKVIGKSRSHLANTLRLLKLPDGVQDLVRSGALSAGHARALIGRADAAALAERIVNEGLTVRQVEALVQDARRQAARAQDEAKNADTRAAESELNEALGPRCRDPLRAGARRASFASATPSSTSSRTCATGCCAGPPTAKRVRHPTRKPCSQHQLAGDSDYLKNNLLDWAQGGKSRWEQASFLLRSRCWQFFAALPRFLVAC